MSCHQEIAADGASGSLGMIAAFGDTIRSNGAWWYRRLFWEAGVLGHVLYLEAEACWHSLDRHRLLFRRLVSRPARPDGRPLSRPVSLHRRHAGRGHAATDPCAVCPSRWPLAVWSGRRLGRRGDQRLDGRDVQQRANREHSSRCCPPLHRRRRECPCGLRTPSPDGAPRRIWPLATTSRNGLNGRCVNSWRKVCKVMVRILHRCRASVDSPTPSPVAVISSFSCISWF